MKKILAGLGAAGFAYALIALIYGHAEYAAAGPISIPVDWLQKIGPVVFGVFWPLITSRYPVAAKVIQYVWNIFRGNKRSPLVDVILKITEQEIADVQAGLPTSEISTARASLMRRIGSNAKAD